MLFHITFFSILVTIATAQKTIIPTHSILGPNFVDDHVDFGYSVRSSSSNIVIGAPKHGDDDQGTIFIFDEQRNLQTTIEGQKQEQLGDRFDLSNTHLALRRKTTVEVYNISTMQLIGQPIESRGGNAVTILDEVLVVSEESASSQTGQVRIFSYHETNNTWIEQASLVGPATSGRFGHIAVFSDDGTRLAVSAPNAQAEGDTRRGMVVVYENLYGKWNQLGQVLTGNSGGDTFGFSMAFSPHGDTLIVGAPGSNGDGAFRGEVTVYQLHQDQGQDQHQDQHNIWIQIGDSISGNLDRDRLGRSLACNYDGSRFVVSSYLHSAQRGQIRVFDLDDTSNGYAESFQYVGENKKFRLGYGLLGINLSLDGEQLLAGATWAGGQDSYSGKVEIFDLAVGAVTMSPTGVSSKAPTTTPSVPPSMSPTMKPTLLPSTEPITGPSLSPTCAPTVTASSKPTSVPTSASTLVPTSLLSSSPTVRSSGEPTGLSSMDATSVPSFSPTMESSMSPSSGPSDEPSPSSSPSFLSVETSRMPSSVPSSLRSAAPSVTVTVAANVSETETERVQTDGLRGASGPRSSASLKTGVTVVSVVCVMIVQVLM